MNETLTVSARKNRVCTAGICPASMLANNRYSEVERHTKRDTHQLRVQDTSMQEGCNPNYQSCCIITTLGAKLAAFMLLLRDDCCVALHAADVL
jgi:hypothetical protein